MQERIGHVVLLKTKTVVIFLGALAVLVLGSVAANASELVEFEGADDIGQIVVDDSTGRIFTYDNRTDDVRVYENDGTAVGAIPGRSPQFARSGRVIVDNKIVDAGSLAVLHTIPASDYPVAISGTHVLSFGFPELVLTDLMTFQETSRTFTDSFDVPLLSDASPFHVFLPSDGEVLHLDFATNPPSEIGRHDAYAAYLLSPDGSEMYGGKEVATGELLRAFTLDGSAPPRTITGDAEPTDYLTSIPGSPYLLGVRPGEIFGVDPSGAAEEVVYVFEPPPTTVFPGPPGVLWFGGSSAPGGRLFRFDTGPQVLDPSPRLPEKGLDPSVTFETRWFSQPVSASTSGGQLPVTRQGMSIKVDIEDLAPGMHEIVVSFADGTMASYELEVRSAAPRSTGSLRLEVNEVGATDLVVRVSCWHPGPSGSVELVEVDYSLQGQVEFDYRDDGQCRLTVLGAGGAAVSMGPYLGSDVVDYLLRSLNLDDRGDFSLGVVVRAAAEQAVWVAVVRNGSQVGTSNVVVICNGNEQAHAIPYGEIWKIPLPAGSECAIGSDVPGPGLGAYFYRFDGETGGAQRLDFNPIYLNSGVSLVEVIDIYPSPLTSSEAFVWQQFHDLLGRPPTGAEYQSWTSQLDGGLTRAGLVTALIDSEEYSGIVAPVVRLYFAYFDRLPDTAGLSFWIEQRRSGWSLARIASFFGDSPEFERTYGATSDGQFVDLVYTNVLGRSPDAAGRSYWVGRLGAGLSRGALMVGFSESPEYRSITESRVSVTAVYLGLLRRAPDAGGLAYWMSQYELHGGLTALIDGVIFSPEYSSRFDYIGVLEADRKARSEANMLGLVRGRVSVFE